MGEFLYGTSSWSEKSWAGVFYPDGLPAGAQLAHYATQFRTVEADVTYYRVPDARLVRGWEEKTPEGFVLWPSSRAASCTEANRPRPIRSACWRWSTWEAICRASYPPWSCSARSAARWCCSFPTSTRRRSAPWSRSSSASTASWPSCPRASATAWRSATSSGSPSPCWSSCVATAWRWCWWIWPTCPTRRTWPRSTSCSPPTSLTRA
ncbi:MAG: DUF72 domain-containing protein [Planctomycetes bacterium]|nr:DUF72 domain-containing protein [Planctomycetota bacterium]